VSLLSARSNQYSFERLPSVAGMEPENLLEFSDRNIRFDNCPNSFGISPEKVQPTRIKFWRLLKDPMVAGRGPPKSLL